MIFYSFLAVKPACVCEQFFGRHMRQFAAFDYSATFNRACRNLREDPDAAPANGRDVRKLPGTSRTYKVLCGTFFEQGENPHGQHDEDTYTAANQPPIHPGIGI